MSELAISRRWLGPALVLVCVACGKPEPVATTPQREPIATSPGEPQTDAPVVDTSPVSRVPLTAEFHRTRVGAGSGYWVLGMVRNDHDHAITDLRAQVRLLDAEGKLVGRAEAAFAGHHAAGAQTPVAVHVSEPVEHERLELLASAIESSQAVPELPLTLEHDPPARGELGGWFVRGQVSNTGTQTLEGVRLEVQGLDTNGQLLGIDWLVFDAIAPGEVQPFDLGELRYEVAPTTFALGLRGP